MKGGPQPSPRALGLPPALPAPESRSGLAAVARTSAREAPSLLRSGVCTRGPLRFVACIRTTHDNSFHIFKCWPKAKKKPKKYFLTSENDLEWKCQVLSAVREALWLAGLRVTRVSPSCPEKSHGRRLQPAELERLTLWPFPDSVHKPRL